MKPTLIGSFALSLALVTLASGAEPARKPTPQQIANATASLKAANCALQGNPSPIKPWELRKVKPGDPPAPIEILGFPNDTSDQDLAKLVPMAKNLPDLNTVILWQTAKITPKGLKLLTAALPNLKGIMLNSINFGPEELREFAKLKNLTWFWANSSRVGNAGLKEIAAYPSLQTLTLIGAHGVDSAGIESLMTASKLRELTIDVSVGRGSYVETIAKLEQVTSLHIAPVTDSDVELIAKMKNLEYLDLTSVAYTNYGLAIGGAAGTVSDSGLESLTELTALATLKASSTFIKGTSLSKFAKYSILTELSLPNCRIADEGCREIAKLKTLKTLNLSWNSFSSEAAEDLAELPKLEHLNLNYSAMTDKAVLAFTNILTLISLELNGTKVAMSDSISFSRVPRLKYLALQQTNVSVGSFNALGSARSLALLDLRSNCPNLTTKDIPPLQAKLPSTRILSDYSCYYVGWPGAQYYHFYIPEVKSPTTKVTQTPTPATPPQKMPVTPVAPPKVAPPVPTITGGGTSGKP